MVWGSTKLLTQLFYDVFSLHKAKKIDEMHILLTIYKKLLIIIKKESIKKSRLLEI